MKFYLGCAVWSYKDWVGNFYPPKTPTKDFLRLYSQRFTTVEGNTTFYAIPEVETVQRWGQETSSGFQFCLKFPKDVTHRGSLLAAIPTALSFLERVKGLGDRLGPVFAQLPPSYSPSHLDDLTTFLAALSGEKIPLALEVRHLDWFQEPYESQLNRLLESLGVGRVLLDTRPIYRSPDDPQANSSRRKPDVPVKYSLTADFSLIRFISHPQLEFNQAFLEEWAKQVAQWLRQGKRIYFFVHCPLEARSPFTARHFQYLLEQQGVDIPRLPWNQLTAAPQQLSLFTDAVVE